MNSKSKYTVLLLSSLVVIYAIVGGMMHRVSAQSGSYQQLDTFNEVLHRIQAEYVDEPNLQNVFAGAIRGLVEQTDQNGGYLTAKDLTFYNSYNPLKTAGIGVVVEKRGGYPMILSVLPGSSADKAGLVSGDMLESIDGVATREMNIVQVEGYLANPPDKAASLIVVRRQTGEPETISVGREIAKAPPVEARMVDGDIAYIRVRMLAPGKAAEARRQLDDLLKKGAAHVILDLRTTAGGEEQEAIALASAFLDSGSVGYVQGQKVEKRILAIDPKASLTKAPLAVLVDQGTAGAAEIVAGAIRDNNRGQVVGIRTFGSASVRKLLPVEPIAGAAGAATGNGDALLLAVAKYYTPGGKDIEEEGIRPQVEVTMEEVLDLREEAQQEIEAPKAVPGANQDRQLDKAIEVLKPKVAKKLPA